MNTAVMPTYGRADISFEKGEGVYLIAMDGRRYLDFGSGIAVNALGHSHPRLVKALQDQVGTLWHTSNLYHIPQQTALAELLCKTSFADLAFSGNSGAEAVEAAGPGAFQGAGRLLLAEAALGDDGVQGPLLRRDALGDWPVGIEPAGRLLLGEEVVPVDPQQREPGQHGDAEGGEPGGEPVEADGVRAGHGREASPPSRPRQVDRRLNPGLQALYSGV